MPIIALDSHKHYTQVCVETDSGDRLTEGRIGHKPGVFRAFFSALRVPILHRDSLLPRACCLLTSSRINKHSLQVASPNPAFLKHLQMRPEQPDLPLPMRIAP